MNGFVLAGGQSSRFGSDKALFQWNGRALFRHSSEILSPFCETVSLNSANPVLANQGFSLVTDLWPDLGPMGGIFSCLRVSDSPANLFLPCDSPLVPPELLNTLLSISENADAVIPRFADGKIEPLIGIYHQNLIPVFGRFILEKKLKMSTLIYSVNSVFVEIDDSFLKKFPLAFCNFNRLTDCSL
jgi:molybdopterin-guanine dinucleotide biosynthesis protein A